MMKRLLLTVVLLLSAAGAHADELLMVRAPLLFPEAINTLEQAIKDHGYRVQRVQRVDFGLHSSGFKTAEYRIVFFGKPEEFESLAKAHPTLLPYLPLKITIFAEGESTLLVTNSPALLGTYYKDDSLQPTFRRWDADVRAILDQVMK
jgi:uncharacterized protein (DUF302 family)